MNTTYGSHHMLTAILVLVGGAGFGANAQVTCLKTGLPDSRTLIREDPQGRLYFAFAAASGSILLYDGARFTELVRNDIGGIAPAADGRVWFTASGRIKAATVSPYLLIDDRTDAFSGPVNRAAGIFASRTGGVWVDGCPKALNARGEMVAVPPCPIAGPSPAPAAEDPFGNGWALVRQDANPSTTHALVLPATEPEKWKSLGPGESLRPGPWHSLLVDGLGYVWVAGEGGAARFDPRKPNAGWVALPAVDTAGTSVTALGLSPNRLVLLGCDTGAVFEADMHADGKAVVARVDMGDMPAAPVRAIHTDRDGTIWAVVHGGIYRKPSTRLWRELAPLPSGNHDFYGTILDKTLYVAGGITPYGLPAKMTALNLFCSYDARQNRWIHLPNLPTRRGYSGIAVLAGEIWVLGGYMYPDPSSEQQQTLDVVEVFSPRTQSWRRGPPLDVPRAEMVALTIADRLYVVGGADQKREFKSVISIAAGDNTWRPEPEARRTIRQSSGCVRDGKMFLARGKSD
jgi:streptogramin lyase